MSTTTSSQMESIESMLTRGHRSIRIERHSFVYWGLAGGLLCVIGDLLINHENLPERWQRALAVLGLIGGVIFAAGWLDYRATRRLRRERHETLSFVHNQVYKVWWLLLGLGVLINFSMVFFGGGYMSYSIWMALVGVGLYVHGLFSDDAPHWGGVLMLVVAAGMLIVRPPHEMMRWIAAATFGIGVPLFAVIVVPGVRSWQRRLLESAAWLAVIVLVATGVFQFAGSPLVPKARALVLGEFRQQPVTSSEQVVSLPAGTRVPFHISLSGGVIEPIMDHVIEVILAQPLEVVLRDGEPDGRFRVADEDWKKTTYDFRLRKVRREATLTTDQGPRVDITMQLSTER